VIRAVIEKADGDGYYVRIPAYGDTVIGPIEALYPLGTIPAPVELGTNVILGQIGRVKEDMVILGAVGGQTS
jgi:hypothetical protein